MISSLGTENRKAADEGGGAAQAQLRFPGAPAAASTAGQLMARRMPGKPVGAEERGLLMFAEL